jgi:acyl-CoA reductase-like NAD-dependent aldehyde dehydrogenase
MTTNRSTDTNYTVPLLIDGKELTTSTTFDVINPSTGKKVWASSSASKDDVLSAISAAEKAFRAWKKTKPAERRTILLKAADLLESRTADSVKYIAEETGAVGPFVDFICQATVELLRDVAGRISQALQGDLPVLSAEGQEALVLKEPYGVNFSIAPWVGRCPALCTSLTNKTL